MLAALALAIAAQAAAPDCHRPAADEVLLQEGRVTLGGGQDTADLSVAAVAVKSAEFADALGVSESELRVYDDECRIAYRQVFADAARVRFETARLGGETILHGVAFYPGGSGHGYRHVLLRLSGWGAELEPLAPLPLAHGNRDGFFVGDLGGGRGDGIALWDAEWGEGESHYEPHFADMILYRWQDGGFVGPERLRTPGKVEAEPNAAPAALGLPFRDATRQELFEEGDEAD